MSFKESLENDIQNVFLNLDEFGETRTLIMDGVSYEIPMVITGIKEKDRRTLSSDHSQGLFLVTQVMHCSLSDLDGNQPEKGARIKISESDDFYREYYVAQSSEEMGMLRVELEGIDE